MLNKLLFPLIVLAAVACDQTSITSSTKDIRGLVSKNNDNKASADNEVDPNTIYSGTGFGIKINPEATHDAYDFTFGVANLILPLATIDYSLITSRSALSESAATLDETQKATAQKICQDLAVSESPTEIKEPSVWKKGQKLYLIWRSHYSSALNDSLSSILLKGSNLQCVVNFELTAADHKHSVNLLLNPISATTQGLSGTSKLDEAIKEGLLLPLEQTNETAYRPETIIAVDSAAQILFNVRAISRNDLITRAMAATDLDQCYYAVSNGSTHVSNPYTRNSLGFEIASPQDLSIAEVIPKATGGRDLAQCKTFASEIVGRSVRLDLSCGEYDAIKDLGLEAGCGWDIVIANNQDKENNLRSAVAMSKIPFQNIDPNKANQVLKMLPRSDLNPVRNGKTKLTGFKDSYRPLIEDAFDLWLAVDETTFREDYLDFITEISFDSACTYGGYTYYGAHLITWCGGGAINDQAAANRMIDPSSTIYRAMLAHHENRHGRNFRHDFEVPNYEPCSGTAFSAKIAYNIATECKYDYCRVMRDLSVANYKNELNYSYANDFTGRKAKGLCKTWTTALGISGAGF